MTHNGHDCDKCGEYESCSPCNCSEDTVVECGACLEEADRCLHPKYRGNDGDYVPCDICRREHFDGPTEIEAFDDGLKR